MRLLTPSEITQLEQQGCSAECWPQVQVADEFQPGHLHRVKFTGVNTLGKFDTEVTLPGGVKRHTGITDAWLHNCRVGNNVLIQKICDYISNYIIEDDVVIFDVELLAVDGESTFGNGLKVETVSEVGARGVMIYNELSAHLAYILASYRHRPQLVENIEKLITAYSETQRATVGRIAAGARLLRCDTLMNVNIGEYAVLEGARLLKNGTINSEKDDPVYIGDGCELENFIVCAGAVVQNATLVSNSFIGQGCLLDKHYSVVQSLFFANCQGFHGEATSIFAGPYTVTHHKSTLLIAGMFSFMNAGSGSNQSNHLYKLGPIHHGFLERGAKTTSNSYILWPARIGAFTLIMGRHFNHPNVADFPFSYLVEHDGYSYLAPAVNLRSIGTVRDAQKWPKRDRRKVKTPLDHINYNLLSPYTIGKVMRGRELLTAMRKDEKTALHDYHGVKIEARVLERGIALYDHVIDKFLGNSVISRLQLSDGALTQDEIRRLLRKDTDTGSGKWVDIAGLICPAAALNEILDKVESGAPYSLEEISNDFKSLHRHYYSYEWTWAYDVLERLYGKPPGAFTTQDIVSIVKRWIHSVLTIDQLLYEDARKEFTLGKMAGYGADGDEEHKEKDFENVRGLFHTNDIVLAIKAHMQKKEELGNSIIQRIA
jgi:NDP-sugar pyrophosphorylase family protein